MTYKSNLCSKVGSITLKICLPVILSFWFLSEFPEWNFEGDRTAIEVFFSSFSLIFLKNNVLKAFLDIKEIMKYTRLLLFTINQNWASKTLFRRKKNSWLSLSFLFPFLRVSLHCTSLMQEQTYAKIHSIHKNLTVIEERTSKKPTF